MSTLLTTATVAAYVKEHLRGIADLPLDLDAELSALEITDGNLNYAWHVHEVGSPSRAVFVKQAPGFIKCLGPEFELSAQRAVLESAVLQEFHRLAPSHSPRHLLLDEVRGALVRRRSPPPRGYALSNSAATAAGTVCPGAAVPARLRAAAHRAAGWRLRRACGGRPGPIHGRDPPADARGAATRGAARRARGPLPQRRHVRHHGRVCLLQAARRSRPDQQMLRRTRAARRGGAAAGGGARGDARAARGLRDEQACRVRAMCASMCMACALRLEAGIASCMAICTPAPALTPSPKPQPRPQP